MLPHRVAEPALAERLPHVVGEVVEGERRGPARAGHDRRDAGVSGRRAQRATADRAVQDHQAAIVAHVPRVRWSVGVVRVAAYPAGVDGRVDSTGQAGEAHGSSRRETACIGRIRLSLHVAPRQLAPGAPQRAVSIRFVFLLDQQ